MPYTEVKVTELPDCDLCHDETKACYDGKTDTGLWAYMCKPHFIFRGIGLGPGKGQKLILEERQ